jgi:hypothetical protein
MKILAPGSSATWTDTNGRGTMPDITPYRAGFPGLEFEKVTETGLEFPVLFAASQAVAVRE